MRVTISGSQSVGKTTLVNFLKKHPFIKNNFYVFDQSISRQAKRCHMQINEDGDDTTQHFIMGQHLMNYATANKHNLYDRCALDGYVYTTWLRRQDRVSPETYLMARAVFECLKYDLMFYIPPEKHVLLENDGDRSISVNWQEEIHYEFETTMAMYDRRIIRLVGSVQERADRVIEEIKKEGLL